MLRMPSVNNRCIAYDSGNSTHAIRAPVLLRGHPVRQGGLEQRLIALRAALDVEILDLFQVVTADRSATLG